jgi:drug/metabolite transporter (DMT)-like permease
VALAVAVVAFAPVAALTWDVEAAALPYAAASAVLELAYFAVLAVAYRRGRMSVVYPVARGSAPVIVLAISLAALGASASLPEAAGVLAVAAGVFLVRGAGRHEAGGRELAFGLAVGACIAGYTLVDNEALAHADPLPYLELVLLPTAAVYLVAIRRSRGAEALRRELHPAAAAIAVAMFGAYALALAALERAAAAPVAAVRETSVVIAVGLAGVVLGEQVTRRHAAGAAVVAAGIAAIALG